MLHKEIEMVFRICSNISIKKRKEGCGFRSNSCSCVNGVWWVGSMLRNKCYYVCLTNVVVLLSFYFFFVQIMLVPRHLFLLLCKKEVLALSSFLSERYNTHSKNQFSRTKGKKRH